jgi:hypothetical protein
MLKPFSLRRAWWRTLVAVAAVSTVLSVSTTSAPASVLPGSTTSTTVDESAAPPVLYGSTTVSAATVTTPGQPSRTLDANHMTAFIQTWLAYSIYDNPPNELPPAELPVSRLAAQFDDGAGLIIDMEFLYATDGTNVWVGARTLPAPEEKWIRAPNPSQTTEAFEGNLDPVRDPIAPSTTSTATTAAQPAGSSGNDIAGPVGAAALAALVAVAAVFD